MTNRHISINTSDWVAFGVDATPSEIVSTKEKKSIEKVVYTAVWHNDFTKLSFIEQYKNVMGKFKLNHLEQLENLIFEDEDFIIRIFSVSQSKEKIYTYAAVHLNEIWSSNKEFISFPKKKVKKYGQGDLRAASFLVNGIRLKAHTVFSLMGYLLGFSIISGQAITYTGHLIRKFGDKQPKKVAFLLDNLPGDKLNVSTMYDAFLFLKDKTKYGRIIESLLPKNLIEEFGTAPLINEKTPQGTIDPKDTAIMCLTDWISRIMYVYVNYKNRKHPDVNIEDSKLNRRLLEMGEKLIKKKILVLGDINMDMDS